MNASDSRRGDMAPAHHVHSDEQHAQAGQNLAEVLELGPLDKDHHGHADEGEQGSQFTHVPTRSAAPVTVVPMLAPMMIHTA